MKAALFVALLALAGMAGAAELRPFDAGSPRAIGQAQAGKPYVLVLWSLYCEPCREEMGRWGPLQKKYPGVAFVLVSTDLPQDRAAVGEFLKRHDLGRVQSWVFADEFVERVRYAIDPAWRGELPRTYLFDASHRSTPYSGILDRKTLEGWLAKQRPRPSAK